MKIDSTIKEYFRRGIKLFYETQEKATLKKAFEQTLLHFFHQGIELRNGMLVPVLPPAEELPTLEQFRYWYDKEYHFQRPIIASEDEYSSLSEKQEEPGGLSTSISGPGSVYKIFATVVDIYLVSTLHCRRVIGRPVIHIITDVFSDLIVGMSVSLEGPSQLGAMLALENATRDKVVFCRKYGIDIAENEWPSHHLPQTICVDQEETLPKYTDRLTKSLNIRVTNAAPYHADWKGYFERSFRMLDALSIYWLPGSVNNLYDRSAWKGCVEQSFHALNDTSIHQLPDSVNNLHEPERKDHRLDACLTFYDFHRLLISCILEYNVGQRIREDHFYRVVLEDEVEPYPRDIWIWGIQNRIGFLREVPIDVLRLHLLPRDHALVTQQGIRFHNLHYTCDRALQEQWFEQVRNGKRRWSLPVVYDPQTSDSIYLYDENGMYTEVCSLIERDKVKFTNCSWFDVDDYFALNEPRKQANMTRVHQQCIDGSMLRDRIIDDAKRREEDARGED